MYSDYAGNRESRPLRRRSISSPRVAPFSPFTPSLIYRSPLVGRVQSPTLPESPADSTSKHEPLFAQNSPKNVYKPSPRSERHRYSRIRFPPSLILGRASLALMSLLLWCTTWYFFDRYRNNILLDTTLSDGYPQSNRSSPYHFPYLSPSRVSPNSHYPQKTTTQIEAYHYTPGSAAIHVPENSFESSTPPSSLTVVLPCPSHNLTTTLPRVLYTLSARYLSVGGQHAIVVVCPSSQSREALRIAGIFTHREIYVHVSAFEPNPSDTEVIRQRKADMSLVHIASQLSSEWVLVLPADGVIDLPLNVITLLHHPPRSIHVPFGPRGIVVTSSGASCVSNSIVSSAPIVATFLVPPFLVRTSLLLEAESTLDTRSDLGIWATLGLRIATLWLKFGDNSSKSIPQEDIMAGGLVVGLDDPSAVDRWCSYAMEQAASSLPVYENGKTQYSHTIGNSNQDVRGFEYLYALLSETGRSTHASGTIIVLLPAIEELVAFSPALCRSSRMGHRIRILLYGRYVGQVLNVIEGCHIHYGTLSKGSNDHETLDDWLSEYARTNDVVVAVAHDEVAKKVIELALLDLDELRLPPLTRSVIIWLPANELALMEWTGVLTITEWRREC